MRGPLPSRRLQARRLPSLLLVPLLALPLLTGCGDDGAPSPADGPSGENPSRSAGTDELSLPVDLYFPAPGGRLGVETREVPRQPEPAGQVRAVVEAVLAGPGAGEGGDGEGGGARSSPAGLVRPLPEDVTLDGVYLGADGTAFLDLRTPEPREPPAMGSTEERQIVYSLVNSVALNVPRVRRVAILWNGRQRATFAGHLDVSLPLAPSRALGVGRGGRSPRTPSAEGEG